MFDQTLTIQAERAYEAALSSPSADWRAVAELFRAAVRANPKRPPRSRVASKSTSEIADYNVDRIKLKCSSPRIAVRFMDGETVLTHVPSAPGKPLNVGRALRVAIAMYRTRRGVQRRAGFREYDRAIPVPEIFQVRCLETDELFDVGACNRHTAAERASNDPERAAWLGWGPVALSDGGLGINATSAAARRLRSPDWKWRTVPFRYRRGGAKRDRRRHQWHGQ